MESLNNASVDVWVKTVPRRLKAYLRFCQWQHEVKMQTLRIWSKTKFVKNTAFEFGLAGDSDIVLWLNDLKPPCFNLNRGGG